jgi:hypothetical protein
MGGLFLSSRFRRLFPVPFAGLRVVVGGTTFNHIVAKFGARHDERGEIATAKAECAEGKTTTNSNSGSLIAPSS